MLGSSRCRLTQPNVGDPPPSLHGHYPASSLLWSSPNLAGASVLSASRLEPLAPFPLASPARSSSRRPEEETRREPPPLQPRRHERAGRHAHRDVPGRAHPSPRDPEGRVQLAGVVQRRLAPQGRGAVLRVFHPLGRRRDELDPQLVRRRGHDLQARLWLGTEPVEDPLVQGAPEVRRHRVGVATATSATPSIAWIVCSISEGFRSRVQLRTICVHGQ